MKPTLSITSRQLMLREMHDYLMIALGMLFYAIGWTVFLLPNDITTGGVPGIASIVYWATGINVQYTYFAINGGLLIASLIVLDGSQCENYFCRNSDDYYPSHYSKCYI